MKKALLYIFIGLVIFAIAYYLYRRYNRKERVKLIIRECTERSTRPKACGAIQNDEKSKKELNKLSLPVLQILYNDIVGGSVSISDWSSGGVCDDNGCDKLNKGYDCDGFPSSNCGFGG